MDKRYQVFVSSTYSDLQEERQEIMQALLELDCIPSGMELFPAANEDQWTLIKKVVDDCDYYIVIIGGRYGSIGPEGISYTEMEYKYAIELNKPTIAFLHSNPPSLPANRCEDSDEGRKKLATFKESVERKMCKYWDTPSDLGSKVSRSIIKLIKDHPAIGWVRGDQVPDESITKELLGLRKKIEELESELNEAKFKVPEGTDILAQGEEEYSIDYTASVVLQGDYKRTDFTGVEIVSWNNIFAAVAPLMINEARENELRDGLNALIKKKSYKSLAKAMKAKAIEIKVMRISNDCFQTIKVQLRALGLVAKNSKPRSVKDTDTYWTLTPYGDTLMVRLRAIHREQKKA